MSAFDTSSPPVSTMLALDAVTLHHGPGFALRQFSLAIAPAQVTALVGPSGCGKSTVLRLAAGLLVPEQGRVLVAGRVLDAKTANELRRRLGYVLQEGGLFPHLTALENVTLMARFLGWPKERIAARVDELLALVQLTPDKIDRRPAQLSGGERQRVSLARALMLDPDLLLLDEPLGALDPIVRHDLQRELRDLFRRLGKAVVVVTHDVAEAGYLASDVVLMRAGAIVQRGSLVDLVRAPADDFVAQFVAAQRQLGDVTSGVA
jgi:osmoprotectant transport system ATP-binding protein